MTARLQLIRQAATRESTAEQWRERMDEWMDMKDREAIRILWQQTVDVFQQSRSFWNQFTKTT